MPFVPLDQVAERPARSRSGFVPLDAIDAEDDKPQSGFIPLEPAEPERPSVLKTILLENPGTAIGETALNLGTMGVALPVAGLAGIGTAAARAIGLTDREPADVVHSIGNALTYQPRGEFGKAATAIATAPFEALAKVGAKAGDATLNATDSPVAATAIDTAINALPMAIAPAIKGAKAAREKFSPTRSNSDAQPTATPGSPDAGTPEGIRRADRGQPQDAARDQTGAGSHEARGFIPLDEVGAAPAIERRGFIPFSEVANEQKPLRSAGGSIPEGVSSLAEHEAMVSRPNFEELPVVRGQRSGDLPGVGDELSPIPGRRGSEAEPGTVAVQNRSVEGVRPDERHVGAEGTADAKAPALSAIDYGRDSLDDARGGSARGNPAQDVAMAPSTPRAARWALVEADDLKASHDSNLRPVTENPFGREGATRHDNEIAVQQIVGKFNPARLADALDDADGAPIVARDGVVEAGQRRAIAMQRVYQANGLKAENYRQHLRENAGRLGLDPAAIDQMKRPALVRIPDEPAPRPVHAETVLNSMAETLRPIREQGQHLGDALAQHGIDAGKLSPETREAVQFLHDHPERAGEFSARVQAALDDRRTAGADSSPAQGTAAGVQNGTWNPGANYSPFVDQVRAPTIAAKTVADLPAPKRREHIISQFAYAIGTTVYEGRVKGKNRLGFFRPKLEEVRIKRANDIEVAAHEVAHLIDSRVPELAQAWKADKALAAELKSVSYDQKNVREGWAEGMRLWLSQPETLEAKAPRVHAFIEGFADSHQYGPALRKAQADMTAWFGQDALNRARSKIGTEKPLAEYFDGFWDKFRQSTTDDLHGIYRMERDLTGKINPNGPYESARTSRASASIADGAVRFGYPVKLPDGSFKFAGKGLEEIMQPLAKSMDDALLYFVGRSARELHGQGREHLFTTGEIDAMLRLRTPERETAFQEYQAWNKGILDFAEAQNIINPEARRLWQRTQYLPFHRVDQLGGLKGKPGDWAGVQALTGGTTNIKDVLGNMIGNAAMLIDKAVKNEARLKIAKLSQRDGGGKFMVKIDAESRPVKISGDQVIDAMLKKYGIAIDGQAPAFFEFLIKGQPPAGNNVVAVMQGGKPIWFEVGDPILYRALKAIDRPVQSEVVRWLGLPKRIGQATITATPDFWMANIARDTLMGSVMSRAGFRPILDSLKGMRMRMTSDPVYKDYLANGGGLSSFFLDEHHLRTKLEKFYSGQGIDYRTVLDAPDKLLTFVETLGDAFEMSTRLGEYKRAIERGENPRHAAYLGRDVSTDFAMRGDSKALGFMMDVTMFLRPALVSWDRLARGLAHDPNKGAIAAKAGTMALMSAGLYLLNRDDPRYADLPDWDRDANWHFFIGDQHFRWPKIWEIGALSSAAERSVEKIMAEDPAGLGKDFARIIGATFNLNYMPQILAPLAEQAANRNSFTKAPIETPGMENVQPFLRSKPGTSETMKAAGMATRDLPEALQVNPARAEALLRGYFNTYALYGLMLSDQALFGDRLPEKRTDELPVVRRFYANEPARHTKYESEFYDMLGEAKRLRGTMRELDDLGLRTFADAKEASPMAGEAKPLERAAKNLGVINKDMEAVRRDANLTPKEKRQKLDALTVERNGLLKAAVTDAKAAQKAKATP